MHTHNCLGIYRGTLVDPYRLVVVGWSYGGQEVGKSALFQIHLANDERDWFDGFVESEALCPGTKLGQRASLSELT